MTYNLSCLLLLLLEVLFEARLRARCPTDSNSEVQKIHSVTYTTIDEGATIVRKVVHEF